MADKLVLILIMAASAPVLIWVFKSAFHSLLVSLFGYNLTYKVKVNGEIINKRVRVNRHTSHEELVAIHRDMVK
jgi:hypothetical protein